MKQTFIEALETVCPNNVFLQGTLSEDEAYPDEFITFFINITEDNAHYDNSVHSIDWTFSAIYYSNDPADVDPEEKPKEIIAACKQAGFIPQGKGNDTPSDRPTHTGWAMNFIATEIIDN